MAEQTVSCSSGKKRDSSSRMCEVKREHFTCWEVDDYYQLQWNDSMLRLARSEERKLKNLQFAIHASFILMSNLDH